MALVRPNKGDKCFLCWRPAFMVWKLNRPAENKFVRKIKWCEYHADLFAYEKARYKREDYRGDFPHRSRSNEETA